MSLATNILDLATDVGTETKRTRTWVNGNAADLSALSTTAKSNLVAAVNEVKGIADAAAGGGISIDDGQTRPDATWSSNKISAEIASVEVDLTELIDDDTASATTVYSSARTESAISAATTAVKGEILGDAPSEALDTLRELGDALGDNESAVASIVGQLGKRVAVDVAQTFDATERAQGRDNLGAASATEVGTLADGAAVAAFEAALT